MHGQVGTRRRGWVDRAIARLAGMQHGVVAHSQLVAAGVPVDSIEWRLRTGRLHRLHRGVYLVGHSVPPPRSAEMAAQLACGPHALISHRSSTRLWEMIPLDHVPALVDVTVVGRRSTATEGIRVHHTATFDKRDAIQQGRLWLTRPARTLLDFAAVAPAWELENAVAQARRKDLVSEEQLDDQLRRNPGRRGAGRLRELLKLDRGPSLTRSPPERRLLTLIRRSSLPDPETNQKVYGFEVDLLWREPKLIVEFDSREFHSDPLAFERDRMRDATLAAHGFVVIRVTDRQLRAPHKVLGRIESTLRQR